MVSKAIGRRKGPINGAANNKPYRRGEKPRLLGVDIYLLKKWDNLLLQNILTQKKYYV